MRVLTGLFHIQNVCMAALARLMPGKLDRLCSNIADGVAPVVAILTETARYNKSPNDEKYKECKDKESRESKKMPRVFKDVHPLQSP
jgi:hypothetical protein